MILNDKLLVSNDLTQRLLGDTQSYPQRVTIATKPITMEPRKIYVVGGDIHYANWMEGEIVTKMEDANLVVFTGGEDVCPLIYNRRAHPTTQYNEHRDTHEMHMFKEAMDKNKRIIGICRGSQFLCAMAGGTLIQDQENPKFYHRITTDTGASLLMTSTHHQAQFPWLLRDNEYKLLAWTKGISNHHDGQEQGVELVHNSNPILGREVEIAFYPKINSLAIQGHPEMMFSKTEINQEIKDSITYCRDLLNRHMACGL